MVYFAPAALLASLFAVHVKAQDSDDIGPAAFLWPPERPWAAAQDNIPPCGSSAGVTNRTNFPLSNRSLPLAPGVA
jgi:hypothetical protein